MGGRCPRACVWPWPSERVTNGSYEEVTLSGKVVAQMVKNLPAMQETQIHSPIVVYYY